MDDTNIGDISNNGFNDRHLQSVADNKIGSDTLVKTQIENELFLSLKSHIDSQCKLNQLNQSRIRSFERFRKYCQRVAQFGDGIEIVAGQFDLGQFRNEFNRFERNYRHWRKRIRKLRNESKSTRNQNPYDTLYELFSKIESLERNNDKRSEKDHQYLSNDQIYPEISLNVIEQSTSSSINVRNKAPVNNSDTDYSVDDNASNYSSDEEISKAKTKKGRKPAKKKKIVVKKKTQISSNSNSSVLPKRKRGRPKKVPDPDGADISKKNKKANPKPKITKVYECDNVGCHYTTTNSWNLNLHSRTHSDVRPFQCDKCQSAFKIKGDLSKHQKHVHEGVRFHCTFEGCTANFSRQYRIRNHIKIFHTKEVPLLLCDREGCPYSTYQRNLLKIHQKIHDGERLFKCPHCEKAFNSASNLWCHKLKHEKGRIWKCDFEGCDYSTYRHGYLKDHRLVHYEDRPYTCAWPGCGDSFKTASGLGKHKQTHANLRRYKCTWEGCVYASNDSSGLRRHIETVHKKKKIIRIRKKANNNNNNKRNLLDSSLEFTKPSCTSNPLSDNNLREMANNCNIGPDIFSSNNNNNNNDPNNHSTIIQLL